MNLTGLTQLIDLANLEPNGLRTTVSSVFVKGLRNDESSSTKHCPSGMNQLKRLVSGSKSSSISMN